MFRRNAKPPAGLGTLVHPAGRVVAHVRREGDDLTVVACGADTAMPEHALPHGVAFADLIGVMHRLDLPPADDTAMPKLIAAQLETLIPDQAEHVRWGWQRSGDAGPVRVVTAARRRVDALTGRANFASGPDLVTTPALALDQVFVHATNDDARRDLAVFGLDGDRLHLLRYRAGQLDALDTVTLDGASPEQQAQAVVALAGGSPPANFTVVDAAAGSSELLNPLQEAWPGGYRKADALLDLPGLSVEQLTLPNLIAVGAAMAAAEPGRSINLSPRDSAETVQASGGPSRRGWVAAAALLVLALGLLYVSDTRRADGLAAAVEQAGLDAKDLNVLNTELAVARHLETSGPSFLAILDELSHRTEGFMVDELRYERDGQFTLQATGQSAQQINQLAATLSQMKTLASVRVRNLATKGRDQIEYTLVAVPAPRFFAAFAPPTPPPPPPTPPTPPKSELAEPSAENAEAEKESSGEAPAEGVEKPVPTNEASSEGATHE